MSELATAPHHGEVHASFDVEHGAASSSSSSSASAAPPPARSTAWSLPPASFSDACRTSLLSAEQRESPRFRPLPASSDEETPSLASPVGASPRCSAALQGSFLVSASGLGASLEMKRIIWMLLWALSMLLTLSAPGPPFGKYNIAWADVVEVLYKWPACAFGAGYLLLFAVFAGFGCIVTPRSWLAIGPALFCFHLFEENGLNGLDARRSPFKAHANLVLKTLCGKTSWEPDFLSDASVMVFSFLHVGGVGLMALWQGPWYGTGVLAFGLTLVDGVLHVLCFVFSGFSYNPGLFSAILLCIPSALYYFFLLDRYMLENSRASLLRVLRLGVSLAALVYFLLAVAILCRLPAVTYVVAYLPAFVLAIVQFQTFQKTGGSPRWAELW
ncbi:hypothetical protein TGME49_238130 [Toxoplasma gondii ME49]|uniref:HXXEE motif protein n=7 Tax=Toxoplasma gondii TaxID=5811 RepID=B6KGA5_TOXGV|nr:hypothetical protein TGME49_238130 [Toxoplasma gondii ME49]ESS31289.1 HXXEE motif protein [Toxoplasma gondii VEG]KFG56917.1 HXXEE motif protein [Toxoplasma gondii RUB]KYF38654.1 HXXEE motif protein [Toxoplasma gondii ARI]EPT30861.1 hypothetical protein TGME49_238130 [Toxoplasma gondii ME49]CEL73489.1 TPA: hypothetical protein BN1205_035990 [Toxoplasma gondii VEG]|eukprot:XP_002366505.1 hypothetical protein TGME49_238130 [Toxoplasma gondii ME49]